MTLCNGVEMPLFQLGTAQMVLPNKPDPKAPSNFCGFQPERTYRQTELALKAGLRAFDTALNYRSQPALGQVLGEWWRTGQLQNRHEIWLTSKILNPRDSTVMFKTNRFLDLPNMTPDQVSALTEEHFERALMELNIGYIDLMLLHWPAAGPGLGNAGLNRQQRLAAWRVLENMYERGWCRAIGVSNYDVKHLEQLQEDGAKIGPMVNQIEASVQVQHVEIREYCKRNGIVPQAYSVLRGLDLSSSSSVTYSTLAALGTKYHKDLGQIAYRYLIQHGYAVIYLTHSEQRMISNANVFDFELTADEMKAMDELNTPNGGWGLPKPQEMD
ncbi:hypothetical protein ACA910_002457 [Epithemia clementina (nom. ined.)]